MARCLRKTNQIHKGWFRSYAPSVRSLKTIAAIVPGLPPVSVAPARRGTTGSGRREPAFAPVFVLVLWMGCLLVGGIGFVQPYARPLPPAPPAPAVQAELIKVDLTPEPLPPPPVAALLPPDPAVPPPLFAPAAPPQAPQLVPVAQPSPAVAFALPIEAPARIVELKQATFVRPVVQPVAPVTAPVAVARPTPGPVTSAPPAPPAPATAPAGPGTAPVPAVESLTFGQGEGRQPAPGYPLSARRAGQEGTVVVRFSIGTNGEVVAAEVSAPSPWSLLNREAVRVVREQWRFKPGPVRLFEVAIRFELKK